MSNQETTEDEAFEDRMDKLQSILDKHEVTIVKKDQLAVLDDYNFILICDDSESMRMSAKPKEQRKLGEKTLTRWMELQEGVSLLIDLLTCFRPEGVDVHFLNHGKVAKVKSSYDDTMQNFFQDGPMGRTPLTSVLKTVAAEHKSELPTIIFVFTDGEPDGGSSKFVRALGDITGKKITSCQFRVQIMACSNNEEEMKWMEDVDHDSDMIDVTDDYYNEKKRVIQLRGAGFTFTRSDWLVKAILGPIDSSVDKTNEGLFDRIGFGGRASVVTKRIDNVATEEKQIQDKGTCAACALQ